MKTVKEAVAARFQEIMKERGVGFSEAVLQLLAENHLQVGFAGGLGSENEEPSLVSSGFTAHKTKNCPLFHVMNTINRIYCELMDRKQIRKVL